MKNDMFFGLIRVKGPNVITWIWVAQASGSQGQVESDTGRLAWTAGLTMYNNISTTTPWSCAELFSCVLLRLLVVVRCSAHSKLELLHTCQASPQ